MIEIENVRHAIITGAQFFLWLHDRKKIRVSSRCGDE
jgi:hypothetical protein